MLGAGTLDRKVEFRRRVPVPTTIVITPDEVPKLTTFRSNVLLTFALVNTASIAAAVGIV